MKRLLLSLLVLAAVGFGQPQTTAPASIVLPLSASIPPPVIPGSVNCTTVGTAGSTTYFYWVGVLYPGGVVFNPSGAASCVITTANATLGMSNYDTISWLPVSVPPNTTINYVVLRNTTATFPGGGTTAVTASTSSTSVNDQSNSLNSYTYTAAVPFNGGLYLDNLTAASPYLNLYGSPTLGLKINGTVALDPTGALANIGTAGSAGVYSIAGNATTAQINAGITIVPAVTGRTLKIMGVLFQAIGGAAAGCTAIQVDDTTGTPVVGVSVTVAALTQNTMVTTDTAPAAGAWTYTTFLTALTANQGLQIIKTGSACTTLTSLNYRVFYTINS